MATFIFLILVLAMLVILGIYFRIHTTFFGFWFFGSAIFFWWTNALPMQGYLIIGSIGIGLLSWHYFRLSAYYYDGRYSPLPFWYWLRVSLPSLYFGEQPAIGSFMFTIVVYGIWLMKDLMGYWWLG